MTDSLTYLAWQKKYEYHYINVTYSKSENGFSVSSNRNAEMRSKLYSVLDNNRHPLHSILAGQRSSYSERLISLRCRTERFRRSFVPTAIRLFNSDC